MTHGAGGFEGRTVLVTGAGSGIGESIAVRLADAGANVVATDINEDSAARVADSLKGQAWGCRLDVTDDAAVGALVDQIVTRYGSLDMAVNNAGIGSFCGLVHEQSVADWRDTMSVNLDGVFYCLRHELRVMLKQGKGAIVNTASVMGLTALPNLSAYVSAKHGVIGLTRAAALDYAKSNIRINAICPGFIKTPLIEKTGPEAMEMARGLHPVGRMGEPMEIAELATFLLSDQASFITGAAYSADGGYTVQ